MAPAGTTSWGTNPSKADPIRNDGEEQILHFVPVKGQKQVGLFVLLMNEKRGGPPSGGPPSDGKHSQLGAARYVLHPRAAPQGDE